MTGMTNSMASSPFNGSFVTMEYPSGYTCTITNGTKTMTSPSGTTSYRFPIKDTGRWNITCTNDSKTKETYIDIGSTPSSYLFRFDNCVTFSSASSFDLSIIGSVKLWDGTIEYSTDRSTWQTWNGLTTLSSASVDGVHKLFVRGYGNTQITGPNVASNSGAWHFSGSGISISGDIRDLMDYTTNPTVGDYAYARLFGWKAPGDSAITDASGLVMSGPLSTDHCCYSLFTRCYGLVKPPKFPTTGTLGASCIEWAFWPDPDNSGDGSLEVLPAIYATVFNDYACFNMLNSQALIKISSTQTGDYQTPYRVPIDGTGSVGTDSLTNYFNGTGGTYTDAPVVNTTYYTSNVVDIDPPWLVAG